MKRMSRYRTYWYEIEQSFYRPNMRGHAGMEVVNNKVYLYGGLSHVTYNDIH